VLLLTTAHTALARAIAPAGVLVFSQSGGQIAAAVTQALDNGALRGLPDATRRCLEAR
jgi:hypothetical protein